MKWPADTVSPVPTIRLRTDVDAPIERTFDLARRVDLHVDSMAPSDESAVAGVTSGLLESGDTVTWRARHGGVPPALAFGITAFDRPAHSRDEQVGGPFDELVHDHYFESRDGRTTMRDALRFRSPLGPIGRLVDRVWLTTHSRDSSRDGTTSSSASRSRIGGGNTSGRGTTTPSDGDPFHTTE